MDDNKVMTDAAGGNVPSAETPEPRGRVRPQDEVREDIIKALKDDKGDEEVARDLPYLDSALGSLYDDYANGGPVPTREALAAGLRGINWPEAGAVAAIVEDIKPDPFAVRKSRKKLVGGIVAAVAAVAIIGGAAWAAVGNPEPDAQPVPIPVKAETPVESVSKAETASVSVNVTCEGWDEETSTPIVVAAYEGDVREALMSTDEDAEAPDPLAEIEVKAGEDAAVEAIVDAGTYTLAVIGSPVLEDGTVFEVPEPQAVSFDGEDAVVRFDLKEKDAADVTEADIEAAKVAAEAAGADASKVESNTAKARSSAEKAQGGTVSKGQQTAVSKPSSSTSSSSTGSKPSSSSSSNSSSNSNSESSTSSSNSSSHTHSWVAQTKTVHHDAVYQTVHHDAVKAYVCQCGEVNPSREHSYQHIINGESDSCSYKTIQEAYDEQVLVSAAWDETVTTGYKCSVCGATK